MREFRMVTVIGLFVSVVVLLYVFAASGVTEYGAVPLSARAAENETSKNFTNGIGMKFVYIEPGSFTMGSSDGEGGRNEEEVQHEVTLTKGFYMQTSEVTQGQWKAALAALTKKEAVGVVKSGGFLPEIEVKWDDLIDSMPWQEKPTPKEEEGKGKKKKDKKEAVERERKDKNGAKDGDNNPVMYISWFQANMFIQWLNSLEDGGRYRLPTEAEWEYACRAGSTMRFPWGEEVDGEYCWYSGNATKKGEKYGHKVGSKRQNDWGLYDMPGNVWEWCSDWYVNDYYDTSPLNDPVGPDTGSIRVLRGGSWLDKGEVCRSAKRGGLKPETRNSFSGFRVVRDPE